MELTSVCIESTLDMYRNDFTCVSKRLWFVSKRLVSKRLCIETTVNPQTHLHGINSWWTCMQNSLWRQIGNRPMPLTSSVMRQSVSNFRLCCCSKKFQMLRKNVKLLLEQLQVYIFAEIVFGVRCSIIPCWAKARYSTTREDLECVSLF